MSFLNKYMWTKIFRNAVVLGGITAVSNMLTLGELSYQNIYAGILAGVLIALVEIAHGYHIIPTSTIQKKAQSTFFLS